MRLRFWHWERITRYNDDPADKEMTQKLTGIGNVTITKHDYLFRLKIFQCPWFGIFLHWFIASDDECQHDHPWRFISIILAGGYWEEAPDGKITWYPPGSILFRLKPERSHRVIIEKPAMTLVIVGPKARSWGFHTLFGWIPWYDYRYSEHCAS